MVRYFTFLVILNGKSNRKGREAPLCRDCGALWKKKSAEFRDLIVEEFKAPMGDHDQSKEIMDPEKKVEAKVCRFCHEACLVCPFTIFKISDAIC